MKINELLGKRIIVEWTPQPPYDYLGSRLVEMEVIEISPSRDYVKVFSEVSGFINGWISSERFMNIYKIIEVLDKEKK